MNISLKGTFSRTKMIWLTLFCKGNKLSAQGCGVILKAAVSSLHPSTFGREMQLGRCIVFLRTQVDRITSNSEGCVAENGLFSSGHRDNHLFGQFYWNFQRFSVGWYMLVLAFYPPQPPILASVFLQILMFQSFTSFVAEAKCPTQATALECFGSQ